MIVDWYRNGKNIYENNFLLDSDPSDSKIKFKQEIMYIVFLNRIYKMTEEQCYKQWCKIKNGIAAVFSGDEEEKKVEFHHIYVKSQMYKYQHVTIDKPLRPVCIYESEINFLNSLDAPLWVRQYWGCLLFFYKFEIQVVGRVQKSPTLNAWCIRQVDYKSKNYGGDCQDIIARYRIASGKKIISDYTKMGKDKYPTYVPDFIAKSGKISQKFTEVSEIKDFLKLIKPNMAICPCCGKKFVLSSKAKRTICEKCYSEQVKQQNRIRMQLKRSCAEEKRNSL